MSLFLSLWVLLSGKFRSPPVNFKLLVPTVVMFILSTIHLGIGLHRLIRVCLSIIYVCIVSGSLFGTQFFIKTPEKYRLSTQIRSLSIM